jgi:nitrite reductase/ring-hydroxylating ferredoxin subunit
MSTSLTPPDGSAGLGEPQDLCASEALVDGGPGHVFDVMMGREAARGFVVRFEGQVRGYLNRCAHMPAELDWQPGHFFDAHGHELICAVHGATYCPRTGRCTSGPGGRGRLMPLMVAEQGGRVCWYPSGGIQPVAFD